MKIKRTEAVVLRRTNYGESDRILQLLTPTGKISVIARGVRKEKSRLAGGIELFAVCEVVVTDGKGELGILTSSEMTSFFRNIMQNYDRMQFAYQVLKLVGGASENNDSEDWFYVVVEVLAALDTATIPIELIETWFYLRYSEALGYELGLFYDNNGLKIVEDKKYRYNQNEKSLELDSGGEITSDHIKFLRLVSTKNIKVLTQIGGVQDILNQCLLLSRAHASI